MAEIIWRLRFNDAEQYVELLKEHEHQLITDEEFAERVATLPGWPLSRPPMSGDNIKIELIEVPHSTSSARVPNA